MLKKTIAMLLVLCMVLPLVPVHAQAQEPGLPQEPIAVLEDVHRVDPGSALVKHSPEAKAEDGTRVQLQTVETRNNVHYECGLLYSLAWEVLECINAHAARRGYDALEMDSLVLTWAMQRAAEQVVYFGNTRPNGQSGVETFVSNYGYGCREMVMVNAASPEQVAEAVDEQSDRYYSYDSVGIGCVTHDGILYWSLVFTEKAPDGIPMPDDTLRTMTVPLGEEYYDAGISGVMSLNQGESAQMQMYLINPEWSYGRAYLDRDTTTFTTADPQHAAFTGSVVLALKAGEVSIQAGCAGQHASAVLSVRNDACSHEWGPITMTRESTCTEQGECCYSCNLCGQVERDSVEPWGHYYVEERCTHCGDNLREDGTALYPYNIDTLAEYRNIRVFPGACYRLRTDLELNELDHLESFSGILDGNGHTVTMDDPVPLFGTVEKDAVIRNLTVDIDFQIDGDSCSYAAVCHTNKGLIERTIVNGTMMEEMSAQYHGRLIVGGICGVNYGIIRVCKNDADFKLQGYRSQGLRIGSWGAMIGGIAGWNYGTIKDCWNDGYLTAILEDDPHLGQYPEISFGGITGVGDAVDCVLGADLNVRWNVFYGYTTLDSGFINSDEYHFYNDRITDQKKRTKGCAVSENSVLEIGIYLDDVLYGGAITSDKSGYTVWTNERVESWWKQKLNPESKPDAPGYVSTYVRHFREWDAEEQVAYFDNDTFYGAQVCEETEQLFLDNVDSMVGSYVLVSTRARTDGRFEPDYLLSAKPLQVDQGTVGQVTDQTITIDDAQYLYDPELCPLARYMGGSYAEYYLLDNTIVGLKAMTKPTELEVLQKYATDMVLIRVRHGDSGGALEGLYEVLTDAALSGYDTSAEMIEAGLILPLSEIREQPLVVSKDGYRDYIIPGEVLRNLRMELGTSHVYSMTAYLQYIRSDGDPYISTVFGRMGDSGCYRDLRQSELKILDGVNYDIIMTSVGLEGQEVTYYLSQGETKQLTSTTGVFSSQELYDVFDFNTEIYAFAVGSGGARTDPQALKMEKQVPMDKDVESMLSSPSIDLFGADGVGVTFPKDVPLIGGLKVSTGAFQFPIGVNVNGSKVSMTLGVDIFSMSEDESEREDDTENEDDSENKDDSDEDDDELEIEDDGTFFKNFKEMFTATADDMKNMDDLLAFYKKCEKKYPGSVRKLYGRENNALNLGVVGYLEAEIVGGKMVVTDVYIKINGEITIRYTQQGAVWVVPAYFYIGFNGAFELKSEWARKVPSYAAPLDFGFTLELNPAAILGGGVGVDGVASLGIWGRGSLPYFCDFTEKHDIWKLKGEFGVEAKFFILEGNKTLLEGETVLLERWFGADDAQSNDRSREYVTQVRVTDRDYAADTTDWTGGVPAVSIQSVTPGIPAQAGLTTLQQSVFDRSQPQLVSLGEKMLMVWVEDDASRDAYNRMRLMYAMFDPRTASWSESAAVLDDGCNDAYPALISDGHRAYLAWQKIAKQLTAADCTGLDVLLENSEICYAVFDPVTERFSSKRILTDDAAYDYAPAVRLVDGEPQVCYMTCDPGQLQAPAAHALMGWTADAGAVVLAQGMNYVMGMEADAEGLALVMDADGDTLTPDDNNVYLFDSQLKAFVKPNEELACTMLRWGQLNDCNTLFVSDGANIYYLTDDAAHGILDTQRAIAGNLNVVCADGITRVFWTENTDCGTNGLYMVSEAAGEWSKPVCIGAYDLRLSALEIAALDSCILGVCNSTLVEADDENGGFRDVQTDLSQFVYRDFDDLRLSGQIEYRESQVVPGTELPLQVVVYNQGTQAVEAVTLHLEDTLGTDALQTVAVPIGSGENAIVQVNYPVPENYAGGTLTVTVVQNGDRDETNNDASVEIGCCDLSISDSELVQNAGSYQFRAVVDNQSVVDAENVTVAVSMGSKEAEPVYTCSLGTIAAGSYGSIEILIDESLIEYDENGAGLIYAHVSTDSAETLLQNNCQCFVTEAAGQTKCLHPVLETIAALEPTCTEDGHTEGSRCAGCGAPINAPQPVARLGHSHRYQVRTVPTEVSCGDIISHCQRCHSIDVHILPALSETDYSLQILQAPTVLEHGSARYTWKETAYGEISFDVVLPRTGSSVVYIDGTVCYDMAWQVLALVNKVRQEQGLGALAMSEPLLETAMLRSQELTVYYSHTRPDGSSCFTAFPAQTSGPMAENIAYATGDARKVFELWMNSSGHAANILDPDHKSIGIGCFLHDGIYYWTQCFSGMPAANCALPEDGMRTAAVFIGEQSYDMKAEGTASMNLGEQQDLQASLYNPQTDNWVKLRGDRMTWIAEPEGIVQVEGGTVTATAPGTAVIRVCAGKNSGSCSVKVRNPGLQASTWQITRKPTENTTGILLVTDQNGKYSVVQLPVVCEENYLIEQLSEASCHRNGVIRYTWRDTTYGQISYELVSARLAHDFAVTEHVAPGCTSMGYDVHTCRVCGYAYQKLTDAATGHAWSSWSISTAPTADAEGTAIRTCSLCQLEDTKPITSTEPVTASGTCGSGVTWVLDAEGTLTISGNGSVTSTPWFNYREHIDRVIVADGIRSLADKAFYNLSHVSSIRIPDSLTYLNNSLFGNCTLLTDINIPSNLTQVCMFAFAGCKSLTEIRLPDTVKWIGMDAFYGCSSLATINIPGGVTEIGDLEYSGNDVFYGCSAMREVHVDSLEQWLRYEFQSISCNPFGSGKALLYVDGKPLTDILLPEGMTQIRQYQFAKSGMASIVLPDSLTNIGQYAFYESRALRTIRIPDGVSQIGNYAFGYCTALEELELPSGISQIPMGCFKNCTALAQVHIPDSVTAIGGSAFYNCSALREVEIPDSVTDMSGSSIFYQCTSLEQIKLSARQTSLGNTTFYECTSLQSVALPDTVTSVGKECFAGCTALTELTMGAGLTELKEGAFSECRALSKIVFNDALSTIGPLAFYNNDALTELVLPDSVRVIGANAFNSCSRLKKLELNEGLQEIGTGAFAYCARLVRIETPHSLTALCTFAFAFCDSLEEAIINGCGFVDAWCFEDCANLRTVTLGEGITALGGEMFIGTSVRQIIIPSTVTALMNRVFAAKSDLSMYQTGDTRDVVIFRGNAPDFLEETFANFSGIAMYPADDETWTEEVRQDYGGNVTWYPGDGVEDIKLEDSGMCGDSLTWTYRDNVLTISGTGRMYNYSSKTPWRPYESMIFRVELPDGLTRIGINAFYDLFNLKEIEIPSGVSIGESAFDNCYGLEKLVVGDNVTFDTYWLLEDCWNLRTAGPIGSGCDIELGYTTEIPAKAFHGMKHLRKVTFPASIRTLGKDCFKGCNELEELWFTGDAPQYVGTFMDGVTATGYYPWYAEGWEEFISQNQTDKITWVLYGQGEPVELKAKEEPVIFYPLNYSGPLILPEMVLLHDSGYEMPIDPGHVTVDSVDTGTYGLKRVTVHYDIWTASFEILIHDVEQELLAPSLYPESTHPYEPGLTQEKTVEWPGAEYLVLSFAADTFTESGKDWVCIYNADGRLVGRYSGNSLAGTQIPVKGDRARIVLETDDANEFYGYTFDSIAAVTYLHDLAVTPGKEATCEEEGCTDESVCRICNRIVQPAQTIPALGHDWDEGVVTIEPTEEHIGERLYTCRRCAQTRTDIIPELEHEHRYDSSVTDPTCTEQGYTTHICRCGDSYVSDYTAALGHDMGAWEVSVEATCTEAGSEQRTCIRCGYREDRMIEARGHDWRNWETVTEASCTEAGSERRSCTRCDSYETRVIAASGHDHEAVVTEPTCTEGGFTTYTCHCGDSYIGDYTEALGHDWNRGIVTVEPTYNTEGEMTYTCFRCSETRTEVIPKLEHEHVYNGYITYPTCTEQGYTTYICYLCADSYVSAYVEPLGHDMQWWYTMIVVTCTEDGLEQRDCSRCDHTETRVVAATGHDFSEWIVEKEPTQDEQGLEYRYCLRCDHTEQRTIAKLENPFHDVAPGSFYYEPVMWAIENGITNGTSATTFGPNDQCMRAHVVTFLWRAVGSPEPTRTDNPFVDVKETDFYYKAVMWAVENGITTGMDATHFGPTAYCNRAQVVTFLYRTMGSPAVESTVNPFVDVAAGSFYEKAVLWAVENGITNGLSATAFGPNSICNRAQIVTFLYRAYH